MIYYIILSKIFGESFFRFQKMDKNKCPKIENPKYFQKKLVVVTIIELYGVVTKKIIFKTLS
jgi:hypothetical protein